VVGATGDLAFRWTPTTGIYSLGVIAGNTSSSATATNADGSIVVGSSAANGEVSAFLWTESLGMVKLSDYLTSLGVNLDGWRLEAANGVSGDGTAIVGVGRFEGHMRGWIVRNVRPPCRADFNGSGTTSVQDIFDFLAAYFDGQFRADFNGSGNLSVQDIFDFLAAYFAGCV
jgi:probable HAF family extracellular repeat protein